MDSRAAVSGLIFYLMTSFGYFHIFKKCGVRKMYALIPAAREYEIGKCADMEKDARTYAIISAAQYVWGIITLFIDSRTTTGLIITVILTPLFLAQLIYMVRIYNGLVKVFNRNKIWVVAFFLFEGATSIYWGLSPKFVPKKKVNDSSDAQGAKVLGENIESTGDGLNINIENRTAIDFFKRKVLLKDIHMNIPKGHMVLLLGGSGAGKTTYVNAVTGYEKADAKIELDGHNIYNEYRKMKYDIGFVPQQDLMRGNDTVLLTLNDAATLRLPSSVKAADRRERVNKVLEDFGLFAVRNSLVEKLSGGQRKRLSIAMEFISDPTLFILDEPDSGLDGVVARGLFEKLRSIADEGKIVIVITHTPDRVIDLFDDVIVLAKDAARTGRLAYYGPVKDSYDFFGKESMEDILLSINQKDEGGEGRADEFVEKYAEYMKEKVG